MGDTLSSKATEFPTGFTGRTEIGKPRHFCTDGKNRDLVIFILYSWKPHMVMFSVQRKDSHLRVMIKQAEFGFPNHRDKLASKNIYFH